MGDGDVKITSMHPKYGGNVAVTNGINRTVAAMMHWLLLYTLVHIQNGGWLMMLLFLIRLRVHRVAERIRLVRLGRGVLMKCS